MHKVVFTGKHYRMYSTVVNNFVSDKLSTPEAIGKWVKEDCQLHRDPKDKMVVCPENLTCKCDGESMGREAKQELRFYSGVDMYRANHNPERPCKEIPPTEYCTLLGQNYVTEAMEAKLRYDMGVNPDISAEAEEEMDVAPRVSTESPVVDGLTHSIHEEQAANDIYEIRAKQAEELGHPHVAALYRHIASEELGHKQRFAIMREEVKKEKT